MSLNEKSLKFLHQWVNKNFLPSIRKGMVEELEQFVVDQVSNSEIQQAVNRMVSSSQSLKTELEVLKVENTKQES